MRLGQAMRDRRERFVALAEARTEKAIKTIRLIGNLSDKRNYEYSESDVKQIVAAIEKELKLTRARFGDSSDESSTSFKLG